ncbi:MAG: DUF1189 domain-containing protein [Candidatus Taylorbacteria bacterium]|nr:DUF1189 domain-containing protein [Candidatus Taylorbacteria bacterium]
MNFLNDIKSSLYDTAFYKSLSERPFKSSMKYFYSLVAVLSFILAFVFGTQLSPMFSNENLRKVVGYYPAELTLTVKNGAVSSNVTEPYSIKDNNPSIGRTANFVVVDTKNGFTRELFEKYNADVWIGKDFAVTLKGKSQTELTDLRQMPDFVLNQDKLTSWADKIGNYHFILSLGLFFVLFFAFLGFFTLKLVWLFIMALIIFLYAKARKISLSYKKSYQIALHAVTVPVILAAIFIISKIQEPFTFFFTLILLAIAFSNIKKSDVTAS